MSHGRISKTQTAKSETLHPTKVSHASDAWRANRHFSPEMNSLHFKKTVRVVRHSKDGAAYNNFFFELDLCISSVV